MSYKIIIILAYKQTLLLAMHRNVCVKHFSVVGQNRVLGYSNSNNGIVMGDFNAFGFFGDTLYIFCISKGRKHAFKDEVEETASFKEIFFGTPCSERHKTSK